MGTMRVVLACLMMSFADAHGFDSMLAQPARNVISDCDLSCFSNLTKVIEGALDSSRVPSEYYSQLCSTLNDAETCAKSLSPSCTTSLSYIIVTSGIKDLCAPKVADELSKNRECLDNYYPLVIESCNSKCLLKESVSDAISNISSLLNNSGQDLQIKGIFDNIAPVCTSSGCMLSCFARDLQESCPPTGELLTKSIIKPLFEVTQIVDGLGIREKIAILRHLPLQCYFALDAKQLRHLILGVPPAPYDSTDPTEIVFSQFANGAWSDRRLRLRPVPMLPIDELTSTTESTSTESIPTVSSTIESSPTPSTTTQSSATANDVPSTVSTTTESLPQFDSTTEVAPSSVPENVTNSSVLESTTLDSSSTASTTSGSDAESVIIVDEESSGDSEESSSIGQLVHEEIIIIQSEHRGRRFPVFVIKRTYIPVSDQTNLLTDGEGSGSSDKIGMRSLDDQTLEWVNHQDSPMSDGVQTAVFDGEWQNQMDAQSSNLPTVSTFDKVPEGALDEMTLRSHNDRRGRFHPRFWHNNQISSFQIPSWACRFPNGPYGFRTLPDFCRWYLSSGRGPRFGSSFGRFGDH